MRTELRVYLHSKFEKRIRAAVLCHVVSRSRIMGCLMQPIFLRRMGRSTSTQDATRRTSAMSKASSTKSGCLQATVLLSVSLLCPTTQNSSDSFADVPRKRRIQAGYATLVRTCKMGFLDECSANSARTGTHCVSCLDPQFVALEKRHNCSSQYPIMRS